MSDFMMLFLYMLQGRSYGRAAFSQCPNINPYLAMVTNR
jgi:hypothetical protein